MNGLEFLQWLRAWPPGKMLPVVVLTGSTLEVDMVNAYKAGANSYVTKGEDAHHLLDQMQAIGSIWLRDTRLPLTMGN
jgi:CheY-like chemotaxis protein